MDTWLVHTQLKPNEQWQEVLEHFIKLVDTVLTWNFPGGSVVKNLPANAGYVSLIPGSGRSPGEGNINPFQYSCLGNPMYRGAWQATQSVELERVRHDKHACADTHTHTHTSPTVLWNNHLTSVYLVAGDPVCCPPPPVKYSHHNDFGTWKPSPAPVWWPI